MLDVFDVPVDKQSDWSARECEPSERGEEMFADGGVAEEGAEPVEMTLGVCGAYRENKCIVRVCTACGSKIIEEEQQHDQI